MRRIRRQSDLIISSVGAVVVLWRLLLPGYVLSLDTVFGPRAPMPALAGIGASGSPVSLALYLAQVVADGWVIEKVVLLALFFSLLYLPLRFWPLERARGEAYFAAVLFAVNPFVYERFLAGQWAILFAYALLFSLAACLWRFYRDLSWRSALFAGAWLVGIGAFSLHLFAMGAFAYAAFALVAVGERVWRREYEPLKTIVTRLASAALAVGAVCLYWIIPAFLGTNTVKSFSSAHWDAFKTAADPRIGALGNVAALYGFWGEHEMWATYFAWPKDSVLLWALAGSLLALVIFAGLWRGLRARATRAPALWLAGIGVLALVFSIGIGDSVFRPFNLWLFEHAPFWQGFRDSQKWSAVLALSYSLLGGIGAGWILRASARPYARAGILALLCALPLLYTPTILLGFNGQLRPVWYPPAWSEVNEVLKKDAHCKAVFLPWHLYYELAFNGGLLTANTAGKYFDCRVLTGADAEIGGVGYPVDLSREYYEVAGAITNNAGDPSETAAFLAEKGIRYVIYTPDIADKDIYSYPFLRSGLLKDVVHTEGIALFEIRP